MHDSTSRRGSHWPCGVHSNIPAICSSLRQDFPSASRAPLPAAQVLTDYDSLPRVFHNVESSMLRQCPDSGQKQLVQTCKWAFLVFRWGQQTGRPNHDLLICRF